MPLPSAPPPLFGRLRRREILHGERRPEHPLAAFSPWTVEPSFLPPLLHPDAGPPPAAGALTSSENAAADPISPPSRRQEASVSYRLHPHARRVASPSWVLERLPLVHLRHGSTAAGRAAMRAWRAVTAPVCARAPRRAVASRAGRVRPGKPWATCAVYMGRASAVDVGHALLCNWAERGFDPVAVELVFYFLNIFKFLQI
jgi:hypothetical protein